MAEPLTDAELREIGERAEKATPGPWGAVRDALGHWRIVWPHSQNSSVVREGKVFSDEDIDFICHARTDVPRLLVEVARLKEESVAWRKKAEWLVEEISFIRGQYSRWEKALGCSLEAAERLARMVEVRDANAP